MPASNNFRHQEYELRPADDSSHFVTGKPEAELQTDECQTRLLRVGECLRNAGVAEIWLVHGTFVGTDALGLYRKVAHFLPIAADKLREFQKKAVDAVQKDVSNYTPTYAQEFESAINPENATERLAVRLFRWSSENHHIGRCHGAVSLMDELASAEIPAGKRVLLWGHSHGGNLFAIVSNLLACDAGIREEFFDAARAYHRLAQSGTGGIPEWQRVKEMMAGKDQPLANVHLDFVTFGTPIRHGWDPDGYSKLLHFVNHRPTEGLPPHQAAFPESFQDMVDGANGDLVQQIGIAGSSFAPTVLSRRAWRANRRVRRLLHRGLKQRSLLARMKVGMRVPDEGTTLLTDYGPPDGGFAECHAGHAVYTKTKWLVFHAEQVAKHLYGYELED